MCVCQWIVCAKDSGHMCTVHAYVCIMPEQCLLKFSRGTIGGIAEFPAQMVCIPKFGIHSLMKHEQDMLLCF